MKKEHFQHRFFDKIKEDYQEGTTFFCLYGNSLFDDFFENTTLLTNNAINSLSFNLYTQFGIKKILLLEKDIGVSEFEINPNNNKINWKNLSYEQLLQYAGRENRSSSPTDRLRRSRLETNSETNNPSEEAPSVNSDTGLFNLFRIITDILKNQKEQVAVIVNSLEWMAYLFQDTTPDLKFLAEIEKWKNVNEIKPLVFILLKKIDILQKYFQFDEKDKGVVAVGGPTIWEITQLYRRLSKGVLTENTLKKIAMMIRNQNYSLYNSIYLYKTIIKEIGDDFTESRFYGLIKEKLRSIDEDVSWDDVHIDQEIKEKIKTKFNLFLEHSGEIKKGIKGFILAGPPGTGKTMIAKALANMGGFYFMPVKLADLKGEFLGHSGKNVQRIFATARANAPTLIFIDEVDAVFPVRKNTPSWDSYVQEMTNQFLAEIDGVDTGKQDVFVLTATNREDIIDPAVKSRLETIHIGLPSKEARLKILQNFIPDFTESDLCDFFTENSEGLSGRDIKNLSENIKILKEKGYSYREALEISFFNYIRHSISNSSPMLKIKFDDNEDKHFFENFVYFEKLKNTVITNLKKAIYRDIYRQYGQKPLNGCLIFGPEGNGKSLMAELVSIELKLKRVILDCESLYAVSNFNFSDIITNVIKLASFNKVMFLIKDIDLLLHGNNKDANFIFLRKNLETLKEHKNIVLVATTDKNINDFGPLQKLFDIKVNYHISKNNVEDSELLEIFNKLLNNDKFEANEDNIIKDLIRLFKDEDSNPNKHIKISQILEMCDRAKYNAISRIIQKSEMSREKITITEIDLLRY